MNSSSYCGVSDSNASGPQLEGQLLAVPVLAINAFCIVLGFGMSHLLWWLSTATKQFPFSIPPSTYHQLCNSLEKVVRMGTRIAMTVITWIFQNLDPCAWKLQWVHLNVPTIPPNATTTVPEHGQQLSSESSEIWANFFNEAPSADSLFMVVFRVAMVKSWLSANESGEQVLVVLRLTMVKPRTSRFKDDEGSWMIVISRITMVKPRPFMTASLNLESSGSRLTMVKPRK